MHALHKPQSIFKVGAHSSFGQMAHDVRVGSMMSSDKNAPAYAQSASRYVQKMHTVRIRPFATMPRHIQGSTTGCVFGRGLRFMVIGSPGSNPSAIEGGRSVTRMRNRICSGCLMTGILVTMHRKICNTSAKCTDMMKETNFWMPA